ncbi:uncharacterized protein LOC144658084 isoform X2 [Oculina patagonica]
MTEDKANNAGEANVPKMDHPFSQPWEDSDLIIVVEGQKFHVHRLMLSLNSPVFKAMFKSEFKEATSVNNVEHLLKLSDEYQVKGILDLCASCLRKERKTEYNALKILLLAQQYRLNNIAKDCHSVLAKMKLERLEKCEEFQLLNNENLLSFLLLRVRLLEELVRDLSPQVAGIVACTMWLWNEAKKPMNWCPSHLPNGKAKVSIRNCMQKCPACKHVIESLALSTVADEFIPDESNKRFFSQPCYRSYYYTDRGDHFDGTLVNVLEKLFNM